MEVEDKYKQDICQANHRAKVNIDAQDLHKDTTIMDYLRTLGSAAVSTLVQKSGLNLPFYLGSKVPHSDVCYNLYDATKRDDGSPVSVFEYDLTSDKNTRLFAQNALRKLRTTRHPDILKFMDAVESDSTIYIMTERVRPLPSVISQYATKSVQEREDWLLWGLHRISVALSFINDQCLSTHGRICSQSIFLSPSGEWKLGGFEVFSNPKEDSAILYTIANLLPRSSAISPPEVKKSGWSSLRAAGPSAADAYALGLLLHAVFNPSHPPPPTADPPHPPPAPSSRGSIPNNIFPSFKRLLNPNPKGRLDSKGFLEIGMAEGGFFSNNRLVKVCSGLDNFSLATETEKTMLLRTLKESANSFPPEFASYKVLPSILSALEFGGASAATIVPLVLQFGSNVTPDEYSKLILVPIVKLFASPDRGTRMALLEHLPEYADKLDKKTVSEKIFPHLQLGFSDTVAVIREATVKSIILIAPKFTDRILNNDLLRLLAKMQSDSEASIRTNTCILLGRLGPSLGYNTKRKVLVPAFGRALKDPFIHARVAGLMAFMATIDCFEIPELASKVIPTMAFTLVDEEKLVRDQAFKALEIFVKKLEEHASQMPETTVTKETELISGPVGPVPAALVNSAAGAAGSLASWAISGLGKKLAANDMQTPINSGTSLERSASDPVASLSSNIAEIKKPSFSTLAQPSPSIPTVIGTKGTALKLGSNKMTSVQASAIIADHLADEAASLEGNPWGSGDLIDVNADDGDWSAFETAPTKSSSTNSSTAWGFDAASAIHQPASSVAPVVGVVTQITMPHKISTPQPEGTLGWDSGVSWDAPGESVPNTPDQTTTVSAIMTKEEKAAEMARRKEERKQRIAMLKEQKKTGMKP